MNRLTIVTLLASAVLAGDSSYNYADYSVYGNNYGNNYGSKTWDNSRPNDSFDYNYYLYRDLSS